MRGKETPGVNSQLPRSLLPPWKAVGFNRHRNWGPPRLSLVSGQSFLA